MNWEYNLPFAAGADPWSFLRDFQDEVNRLIDRRNEQGGYPAINIWSDREKAYLAAELPGVELSDIDITILGNSITVQGKKRSMEAGEGCQFLRRERGSGEFSRTVDLPYKVQADQVDAQLKNGVLLVTLPRAEEDKPKRLTIKKA